MTSGAFHTGKKNLRSFSLASEISGQHVILRVSDHDVAQDISQIARYTVMTNLFHSCFHLLKCTPTRCSLSTSFIRCQAINGRMYEAEMTLPLSGVRTLSFKMKNHLFSSSWYRCQDLVAILCT